MSCQVLYLAQQWVEDATVLPGFGGEISQSGRFVSKVLRISGLATVWH